MLKRLSVNVTFEEYSYDQIFFQMSRILVLLLALLVAAAVARPQVAVTQVDTVQALPDGGVVHDIQVEK